MTNRFEKMKRIHLTLDAGTVENGGITPTFKIRRFASSCHRDHAVTDYPVALHRKVMYEKFMAEIEAMYALPDPVASKHL